MLVIGMASGDPLHLVPAGLPPSGRDSRTYLWTSGSATTGRLQLLARWLDESPGLLDMQVVTGPKGTGGGERKAGLRSLVPDCVRGTKH